MNKKILIVTAHPDDETIVAGTCLLAGQNGWAIHIHHLTAGKNGKLNEGETEASVLANRKKEAEDYAEMLGASCSWFESTDTYLQVDDRAILNLVSALRKFRPSIVCTLHDSDYHFEHKRTREIAGIAFEIATRSSNLELGSKLSDVVLLETDGLNPLAKAHMTINTESVQKKRTEVIKKSYGARLGNYLMEFDNGLSKMRGERVGYRFGESFALVIPDSYQLTKNKVEILQEFLTLGNL